MRNVQSIAVILLITLSSVIARAETIDNPAYVSWSKCKPGTSVVMKSTGSNHDITVKETLVEVTPDKCIVEMATDVAGGHAIPPMKRDIVRQITDEDAIKKFKEETAHPTDETITTPAGTFACKRYEFALEDVGTMKVWLCDTVPGGSVKAIQTLTELKTTTTTELASIDKK